MDTGCQLDHLVKLWRWARNRGTWPRGKLWLKSCPRQAMCSQGCGESERISFSNMYKDVGCWLLLLSSSACSLRQGQASTGHLSVTEAAESIREYSEWGHGFRSKLLKNWKLGCGVAGVAEREENADFEKQRYHSVTRQQNSGLVKEMAKVSLESAGGWPNLSCYSGAPRAPFTWVGVGPRAWGWCWGYGKKGIRKSVQPGVEEMSERWGGLSLCA